MKKINITASMANLNILKNINIEAETVEKTYKNILAPAVVFEDNYENIYFIAKTKEEFLENQFLQPPTIEEKKEEFLEKLWSLIPNKIKTAQKVIIGKRNLTDEQLEVQLKLYGKKYQKAKEGKNVFLSQSVVAGLTQEAFRNLVITKGDRLLQLEEYTEDKIEGIRQYMENSIDNMTLETLSKVEAQFVLLDSFSIATSMTSMITQLEEVLND